IHHEAVKLGLTVYIMKESSELHNNKHKIGKTINLPSRKSNFQTSHASKIEIVHQVATSNAHIVKQVVHSLLRPYHHGKEFYNCETIHSKNLIDFTSAVYDTLHGCYEFITREEIGQKLIEIIKAEMDKGQDPDPENTLHCETTDKDELGDFLTKHCELGEGFQVDQDAFVGSIRTDSSWGKKTRSGRKRQDQNRDGEAVRNAQPQKRFHFLERWGA
ncbi:hypothetical protein HK102_011275, partial [Quaeritorhiza haematococci]